MAEHSICQPGLPLPQGESHEISPGLAAFQSAKSSGPFLLGSSAILPEDCRLSIFWFVSLP